MKKQSEQKKKSKAGRVLLIILISLVSLILVIGITLGAVYAVMYYRGKKAFENKGVKIIIPTQYIDAQTIDDGNVVRYGGNEYVFNENIATVLFMGIDKESVDDGMNMYGSNGQADALYLAVLDTQKNSVNILAISRDTMTDVDVYTMNGEYISTKRMQACLSYAYLDGKEKSCENVCKSVSNILYGMPVNAYFALDINGIAVLNDAIGGVTVPGYCDDLATLSGEQITLWGEDAERYLRQRDHTTTEGNNNRMKRQKDYINAFASKLVSKTKENIGTPLELFNAASPYTVTDIDASRVTYLATKYLDGAANMQTYTVPGESKTNDNKNEFTVDDKALFEMIIELFYIKR